MNYLKFIDLDYNSSDLLIPSKFYCCIETYILIFNIVEKHLFFNFKWWQIWVITFKNVFPKIYFWRSKFISLKGYRLSFLKYVISRIFWINFLVIYFWVNSVKLKKFIFPPFNRFFLWFTTIISCIIFALLNI